MFPFFVYVLAGGWTAEHWLTWNLLFILSHYFYYMCRLLYLCFFFNYFSIVSVLCSYDICYDTREIWFLLLFEGRYLHNSKQWPSWKEKNTLQWLTDFLNFFFRSPTISCKFNSSMLDFVLLFKERIRSELVN